MNPDHIQRVYKLFRIVNENVTNFFKDFRVILIGNLLKFAKNDVMDIRDVEDLKDPEAKFGSDLPSQECTNPWGAYILTLSSNSHLNADTPSYVSW